MTTKTPFNRTATTRSRGSDGKTAKATPSFNRRSPEQLYTFGCRPRTRTSRALCQGPRWRVFTASYA